MAYSQGHICLSSRQEVSSICVLPYNLPTNAPWADRIFAQKCAQITCHRNYGERERENKKRRCTEFDSMMPVFPFFTSTSMAVGRDRFSNNQQSLTWIRNRMENGSEIKKTTRTVHGTMKTKEYQTRCHFGEIIVELGLECKYVGRCCRHCSFV